MYKESFDEKVPLVFVYWYYVIFTFKDGADIPQLDRGTFSVLKYK